MRHELPAMNIRLAFALVSAVFLLGSCEFFGFLDERVREGDAYGFTIGETVEQSINRASSMKLSGTIHEIEVGHGSGAVPFDEARHSATSGDKWQLVVDPEVWNDSIYLTFENGSLVEIWRFRSPTELP
jgi:hypothetical protein